MQNRTMPYLLNWKSAAKLTLVVLAMTKSTAVAQPDYILEAIRFAGDGVPTEVIGLNESGRVTGFSEGSAFYWENDQFFTLDTPHQAFGRAINKDGDIVGEIAVVDDIHAFIWRSGEFTDIHTLGIESLANDLNDIDQVVGWFRTPRIQRRAFFWQAGMMIDIGTLGGPEATAFAINNQGQVVGSAETKNRNDRAFIWEDKNGNGASDVGEMRQLQDAGLSSAAFGVNESGEAVGFVLASNRVRRAVKWTQDGELIDLGILRNHQECEAFDINNNGQIVGTCVRPRSGFIWTDGEMHRLLDMAPAPAVNLGFPQRINDDGVIAGSGLAETTIGFVLAPKLETPLFRRGDANADGDVDISDAIWTIQFLFRDGPSPSCNAAADANGDAVIDLSDGMLVIAYQLQGGSRPAEPFLDCGAGSNGSGLSCTSYPACE